MIRMLIRRVKGGQHKAAILNTGEREPGISLRIRREIESRRRRRLNDRDEIHQPL